MASLESLLVVPPSLHTFNSPLNEQANQVTCFLGFFFFIPNKSTNKAKGRRVSNRSLPLKIQTYSFEQTVSNTS